MRTERWLAGQRELVDPAFADALDEAVDAVEPSLPPGARFVVFEGYRPPERADALHAAFLAHPDTAPRAAAAKDSAHCVRVKGQPAARACDLQLILADGTVDYSYDLTNDRPANPSWHHLWVVIGASSGLHSLWKHNDGCHVEAVNWRHGADPVPATHAPSGTPLA